MMNKRTKIFLIALVVAVCLVAVIVPTVLLVGKKKEPEKSSLRLNLSRSSRKHSSSESSKGSEVLSKVPTDLSVGRKTEIENSSLKSN